MSNVSTKEFRIGIIAVIAVIVTGFFIYPYLNNKENIPNYKFVPSHYATKDPFLADIIRTQAELDSVKKADIYTNDKAVIGSFVAMRPEGYYVNNSLLTNKDDMSVEDIEDRKTSFDVYTFVPDAKLSIVKPYKAHKITTEGELRIIMNDKNIRENMLAALGSYVVQSTDGKDMVIIGSDETLWSFTPINDYEATKAN